MNVMFPRMIPPKIWIALLVFALVGIIPLGMKTFWDFGNKTVDVVISSKGLFSMSRSSGYDIRDVLGGMKKSGVTSVILQEDTIKDLMDQGLLTLVRGGDLIDSLRLIARTSHVLVSRLPAGYVIQAPMTYMTFDDALQYDLVRTILEYKYGKRVKELGFQTLEVAAPFEQLLDLPIDVNIEKGIAIQSQGLVMIPALQAHSEFNEDQLSFKLSRLSDLDNRMILLEGKNALGYPQNVEYIKQRTKELHKMLAFVEFNPVPLGFSTLLNGSNGVRVHALALSDRNTAKYVEQAVRAVVERGARVIWVQPYEGVDLINSYSFHSRLIQRIVSRLEARGYKVQALSQPPFQSGFRSILTLSGVGAFVLLIFLIWRRFRPSAGIKTLVIFSFFVTLGFGLAGLLGRLTLMFQFSALCVSVIVPVLVMMELDAQQKGLSLSSFKELARAVGLVFVGTLIGAVYIQNLMGDPLFWIGAVGFRGVKIAILGPFVLLWLYKVAKLDQIQYVGYRVKRFMLQPINIAMMMLGCIGLVLIAIYLVRSGNDAPVLVTGPELWLRSMLEKILWIRPRTKELFLGYPALVLWLMFKDRLTWPSWLRTTLFLLASLAPISMLNSFAHLHTSFWVTLYRSGLGAILGLLLGWLIIRIGRLILLRDINMTVQYDHV